MERPLSILTATILVIVGFFIIGCSPKTEAGSGYQDLIASFVQPPDSARPGVYWYFMEGNLDREAMTADLESMKKVGIGNLVLMEVNLGIPRGPVVFLSEEWLELYAHAVREAERLGIEISMGLGPGWTGSGGPWVKLEESMKHLVSSAMPVAGPGLCQLQLDKPEPRRPFFGQQTFTEFLMEQWLEYYEDVVVLAVPALTFEQELPNVDRKALFYRPPYTSWPGVKPYLPAPAKYQEAPENSVIPLDAVIDVTEFMDKNGRFSWEVPAGDWYILRFGTRNTGAITRPAPMPGMGFECDKFSMKAFDHHFEAFLGKLIEKTGTPEPGANRGWTTLFMESWEMGAQNWTQGFREIFRERRGYDPLPYLPVYRGWMVGSREMSERFLWDLRITSQELILENHAGRIKEMGRKLGFGLSIEPYDMNPTADLDLGSLADVPMCEFWSLGLGFNSTYSVFESSSIAHVLGRPVVAAEAFTALPDEAWKMYPGAMKNQGDWAFCAGINHFYYHTFAHQPLGECLRPGMTMGPYGVHWDRGQTWWNMSKDYHSYITRCSYMLQQGRSVADVLYMTPQGAPQIFKPPKTALVGNDTIPDRLGHNFDGISPLMLMEGASVDNGKITFPSGASYHLLVLPMVETMTPDLLEFIIGLAEKGATIVGPPPVRSPSLVNYPACDGQVKELAMKIWEGYTPPDEVTVIPVGKGRIMWGSALSEPVPRDLYPHYQATAAILKEMQVREDFTSDGPVRYTHRKSGDLDIYFIANRSGNPISSICSFRVDGGIPESWDPVTTVVRPLPEYKHNNGVTAVPVELNAYQSFFIVFGGPEHPVCQSGTTNFPGTSILQSLDGPWRVTFDPEWGGPEAVEFMELVDWTMRSEEGIRYYSGVAGYHNTFSLTEKEGPVLLDLGRLNHMARVILNGVDLGVVWTAPWQVDISAALKTGENQLEIQVVNLWINRLIGDEFKSDDYSMLHRLQSAGESLVEQIGSTTWPEWVMDGTPRPSDRFTFTTHRYYTRDSELVPSGLLGPVQLLKYKNSSNNMKTGK